jgi:hypothetical protein
MAIKTIQPDVFEMGAKTDRPKHDHSVPPIRVQTHTNNILTACGLTVVPMVAFTSIALAFVFANTIRNQGCSFDNLCPTAGLINATSEAYYDVDFSATSLVFIASWSSTISFALVGSLMSMYAYLAATQMLHHPDLATRDGNSLSPYQLSLIIRVLSAEVLSLWSLIRPSGRKTLRRIINQGEYPPVSPRPLRRSVMVFGLALLGWCVLASNLFNVVLAD